MYKFRWRGSKKPIWIPGRTCASLHSELSVDVLSNFDELDSQTVVSDQYLHLGVLSSSDSDSDEDAPTAYGYFASPISAPNYLWSVTARETTLRPPACSE